VRDILYVAIVLAFFALAAAYIRACAAIVGHDPVVDADADPSDPSETDHEAAEVLS